MSLIKMGLPRSRRLGAKTQGEIKVQAKATMFMKTKAGETSDLIKATISMKTKVLRVKMVAARQEPFS